MWEVEIREKNEELYLECCLLQLFSPLQRSFCHKSSYTTCIDMVFIHLYFFKKIIEPTIFILDGTGKWSVQVRVSSPLTCILNLKIQAHVLVYVLRSLCPQFFSVLYVKFCQRFTWWFSASSAEKQSVRMLVQVSCLCHNVLSTHLEI